MSKKKKFKQWCEEKGRQDLLDEWNCKNESYQEFFDYDFPSTVNWKCKNGHDYSMPIVMRTVFGLNCPICNPQNSALPVGTKYGCLTIIDVPEEYEKNELYEFLGRPYKCQCKCGQYITLNQYYFIEKRHRYCEKNCGIKAEQEKKLLDSYKRVKDENYDIDYTNSIHESLKIEQCINDSFEVLSSRSNRRKHGGGTFKVHKLYKCHCYLCGKEYEFKSGDFLITNKTYVGYCSTAHCDCHKISSFQWRVVDILRKHNVNYRVEESFEDLYGTRGKNLLRFDFAILDDDGNIQCLIECQGEQHYKPVDEFGGEMQYKIQKENDKLKRDYTKKHNIHLIEIPYTCDTYEKEEQLLKEIGVI